MTDTDEAPRNGRNRSGSETRQRTRTIALRCTVEEAAQLVAAADRVGLTIGAYLRLVALGSPGIRAARKPVVQRVELAQVLGLLGRVGGNVNQLAKAFNTDGTPPSLAEWEPVKADIRMMCEGLMQALERPARGHQRR